MHDKLPELFALPTEAKEKCNMINSPSFLGYTRLGAETTAAKTDLREVRPSVYGWTQLSDADLLIFPAIRFWYTRRETLDRTGSFLATA